MNKRIGLKTLLPTAALWLCAALSAAGLDQSTNCWQAAPGLRTSTHQYYDIPAWNCNGSLLLVVGREPNESVTRAYRTAYLVTEIGTTNRRPAMPLQRVLQNRATSYQWDARDPDVLYFAGYTNAERSATLLHRLNVRTGRQEVLATVGGELTLAVPHPDGEHLLLVPKVGGNTDLRLFAISDRKVTAIPVPAAVHRVRLTKHADLSVFCNTQTESREDRLSYSLDIHTGAKHLLVKGQAGHPDWNPDGTKLSFFMNDGLCIINRTGERLQYIKGLSGHQSWSPDGRYIVFDAGEYTVPNRDGKSATYKKYLTMMEVSSEKLIPLVPHNSKIGKSQDTHPHPCFSPDGTKVVFNSNNQGKEEPQACVVKARDPEPVQQFSVTRENHGYRITWNPPKAKETKGFVLYRIRQGGQTAVLAEAPLSDRSYTDTSVADIEGYGISVQEFSGLQSAIRKASLPK